MYGIALTRSEDAAAAHFKQAADLGLADAQAAYGVLLVQGMGNDAFISGLLTSMC